MSIRSWRLVRSFRTMTTTATDLLGKLYSFIYLLPLSPSLLLSMY